MKRFANVLKQEQGFSLIELIATLSILSLVIGGIYGVISFGFKAYNKVTVENSLRDEADILMSSIMTQLYTYGPDLVTSIANENGIEMERTDPLDGNTLPAKQIKIQNHALYIMDSSEVESSGKIGDLKSELADGSSIELDCGNATSCRDGLIAVTLVLEQIDQQGQKHQLQMESRFGF
ncbi:PilW family protein [Paenibacillus hexagrammi]|uniref:Type II secretion system GspH family protein n=1 Tax=Paenibacillus hexagrammi TaxID=2908839 RepID=A0ABY3SSL9_9BACL|nr:type II secretion system protein [Paenibacillus sp. YPD9-1]UJF35982.1 type II secretion system GspH family protein [Paenibacillus sp. YPD9-1]